MQPTATYWYIYSHLEAFEATYSHFQASTFLHVHIHSLSHTSRTSSIASMSCGHGVRIFSEFFEYFPSSFFASMIHPSTVTSTTLPSFLFPTAQRQALTPRGSMF